MASKEKIEKLLEFKEFLEAQVPDSEASLSVRIAKEAYRISLSIKDDTSGLISVALGLLNQAQAIVDKDAALALKLYNRARIIARKQ